MIVKIIKRVINNLDYQNKIKLLFLIIFTFINNFVEICTIFLLFPYLSFLINGTFPNEFLNDLSVKYFTGDLNFLLIFTILYSATILFSFFLRMFYLYFSNKFIYNSGFYFLSKILKNILNLQLKEFIKYKSSDLISIFTVKLDLVIKGVIHPIITIFSTILMILFISIGLFYINFKISLILFISLCIFYISTSLIVRKFKLKNSGIVAINSSRVIKFLNDIFSNIKYIKVTNLSDFYKNNITNDSNKMFQSHANNAFIGMFPKVTIESLILFMIILLSYFMMSSFDDLKENIPYLVVLAISAQKLIPLMQQVYYATSSIYGNYFTCIDFLDFLEIKPKIFKQSKRNIVLKNKINIMNISLSFNDDKFLFSNINETINKGDVVAISGPSGSGKTSLSNIIMGLIEPTNGFIKVDEIEINRKNYLSWQRNISFVPQEVYLINSNIIENITLGLNLNEVDLDKVYESAKVANIHDFIESLPNKYETLVQDGGLNLSGGQRQRIIIARSIYLDKEIFVFDEATSAIDSRTELDIINNIIGLKKTIILISHNKNLLKKCNKLINLEKYK